MLEIARPAPDPRTAADTATVEGGSTVVTIQYLRAIAASLVVCHHAFAPPAVNSYYRHSFGEFGVDLFFVISGYIMWTTTVRGRRGPVPFWAARIVRIVPLYWVYTTLFLLVAIFAPQALFTEAGLDAVFVLKSYLFVPALHPTYGGIAPVYTLGWTLNYEMFFYLVFGFSLVLARPALRFGLFAGLFVLLVLAGWMTGPRGAILSTYTNPILLEFLAGVALAALGPRLMRSAAGVGLAALLVAAAWLVFVVLSEAPPGRLVAFGLPAAVIVAGALMLEPIARLRTSRLALLLGDASYSIYLAHPFAQRVWLLAVGLLVPDLGAPVVAALYVSSALLIGILGGVASYLLLERPLLAAGHRLIGRSSLSRRTMAMESGQGSKPAGSETVRNPG